MAGQTTSSGIQVHRVPASHGWYWLKRGFGLLGRAPLPLLLLMLMLITASSPICQYRSSLACRVMSSV